MATISMVADDYVTTQQYTWEDYNEDYREDLVDKDLGIVRKINLK